MTDYADWTKNLIADIRANGLPDERLLRRAPGDGPDHDRGEDRRTARPQWSASRATATTTSSSGRRVASPRIPPGSRTWSRTRSSRSRRTQDDPGPRHGRGRRRPRRALGPPRRGTRAVRRVSLEDRPHHPDRPAHAARLTGRPGSARRSEADAAASHPSRNPREHDGARDRDRLAERGAWDPGHRPEIGRRGTANGRAPRRDRHGSLPGPLSTPGNHGAETCRSPRCARSSSASILPRSRARSSRCSRRTPLPSPHARSTSTRSTGST